MKRMLFTVLTLCSMVVSPVTFAQASIVASRNAMAQEPVKTPNSQEPVRLTEAQMDAVNAEGLPLVIFVIPAVKAAPAVGAGVKIATGAAIATATARGVNAFIDKLRP